ncbi:MAG: thermostable hemolysin [Pseudohongiella sp.]|nr:thermostable hemolysin [Pseudohongiella sp.]MDP2126961.1 thermostable hemolysin [Pseudohongiella sp.]
MWLCSTVQPAKSLQSAQSVESAQVPIELSASSAAVSKNPVQIILYAGQPADVAALHAFISRRYAETYQAVVTHFLPLLLASVNDQRTQGVLGLRPGAVGQFFSEQYLDTPIEHAISAVVHQPVERRHIIETGNLASMKGGSQRLFIVLTELLYQSGFDWICFTATPLVAALLHRLGFAPEVLANADPSRLPDAGQSWGCYYDNQPNVLVGDVRKARDTLTRNEIASRILQEHSSELAAASRVLAAYVHDNCQPGKFHG